MSTTTPAQLQKTDRTIPVLVYADIPAAHDFLVRVFGFTPGLIHRDPTGRAIHGEVHAGDQAIWLHREVAEFKLAAPKNLPAASSGLMVLVPEVDAHYQQVLAQGGKVHGEPRNQAYGLRDYGVTDPEGYRWWFASPLKPQT